jgi:hypothetical protein
MYGGIKYRGRFVSGREIDFINNLIAENPNHSRRALSQLLCKAWNWVQPNGALQDMICRGFMLHLDSEGLIKLPPRRCQPNNPFLNRKKPAKIQIDISAINESASKLIPFDIKQVRRTPFEKLFNSLISQYHYLGYCQPVGEHLKYIVYSQKRPVACFAWSSSPRHIACRDKFIGWPPDVRMKNLRYIAYNSRFLILPWVRSSNLASYLLSRMAKRLSTDWESVYHHSVYFLETFVDTERFSGICYKAANWISMGVTTGRGKNDQTHRQNRSIKAVWGYPLFKDFRSLLHNV